MDFIKLKKWLLPQQGGEKQQEVDWECRCSKWQIDSRSSSKVPKNGSIEKRIETNLTKGELEEFEQQNIEEAMQWVFGGKFKAKEVFTEKFIRKIHKRMYGDVWAWAGEFRKADENIGIDKYQIPVALKMLCDDAIFWVENETYLLEEIAVRVRHRQLVTFRRRKVDLLASRKSSGWWGRRGR